MRKRTLPHRGEPVRFMIGMFLLKHTYDLSNEQVWDRWVQDPYFQYFTGEEFFQHELRHERSGMSHWRKRIGGKLDILLIAALLAEDPPQRIEAVSPKMTDESSDKDHPLG